MPIAPPSLLPSPKNVRKSKLLGSIGTAKTEIEKDQEETKITGNGNRWSRSHQVRSREETDDMQQNGKMMG